MKVNTYLGWFLINTKNRKSKKNIRRKEVENNILNLLYNFKKQQQQQKKQNEQNKKKTSY